MSDSKDWCKGFCRTCTPAKLSAAEKERDDLKAKLAVAKEALEGIASTDRTISGMGSTSGESKSWWLHGVYGAAALKALKAIGGE